MNVWKQVITGVEFNRKAATQGATLRYKATANKGLEHGPYVYVAARAGFEPATLKAPILPMSQNASILPYFTTPLVVGSLPSALQNRLSSSVRRGVSLVDSSPFVRRVMGSNPALAMHHLGTLGKSFTRNCLCLCAVSGAPLISSGL